MLQAVYRLPPHEPRVPGQTMTTSIATDRRTGRLAALGCAVLLLLKLLLVWRLNINWDEFHFLSDVYALGRGELTTTFLGTYTHLFRWLIRVGQDEVDQVLIARLIMFACLIGTCWGIWHLARIWAPRGIALLAPLCYLSMSSVIVHGASFRYDPMLSFLSVMTLLMLARTRPPQWIMAGLCMGIAIAISLKAVLMLPVAGALAWAECVRRPPAHQALLRGAMQFLIALSFVAAALFWLHSLSVLPMESDRALANRIIRQAVVETPLFPQLGVLRRELDADPLAWALLACGLVVSLLYSKYRTAAVCALSVAPILFYRNSFPYYYVVMLAPVSILAAVLAAAAHDFIQPRVSTLAASALIGAIVIALAGQGVRHAYDFRFDDITHRQRSVIDAVHQIFPDPVPYIDHGGMIASFPKVNFFMSSWGIQRYVAGGEGFMADALRLHRPPLLLANRPILQREQQVFAILLPEDQQLINDFYIPYWGPIHVAGARATLHGERQEIIRLPFPGEYRIEATDGISIDGRERRNGDVIDVGPIERVTVHALPPATERAEVRLLWAAAQEPPTQPPPHQQIFVGL